MSRPWLLAAVAAGAWLGMASGAAAQPAAPSPNALGNEASELVLYPVAPCRIVDTRMATGTYAGRLVAGVPREFNHSGDLSAQGGSATGCGIPNDIAAIVVTLTAVSPLGPGNLRAWAPSAPAPNASVVNFASVPGLALANTTILPTCRTCDNHFAIQADGADVHLVADVAGYFGAPFRTPLSCTTVNTTLAVADATTFVVDSPACPTATTVTGGGHDVNLGVTNNFNWYRSRDNGNGWQCRGRNNSGFAVTVTCYARCCRVPGISEPPL